MRTKVLLSAIFAVSLSFGYFAGLFPGVIDVAYAEKKKDTETLPGPAPSAQCKKQCATQQTACNGRCRGLEPQLTLCQERCAKAFDECVKKCDQMPTSLLDFPEEIRTVALQAQAAESALKDIVFSCSRSHAPAQECR